MVGDPSGTEHLQLRSEHRADGVRITVAGEVDAATCTNLQQALETAAADEGRVELDVRGVTFIDSSGLRVLVLANQQLAPERVLRIAGPDHTFRRLLTITGLDGLFDVVPE
jgi:anti-anti-sigma factor